MLVYKFGGASVSSAPAIENLTRIVSSCTGDLVIVISAFGKTTNALEEILAGWYNGSSNRFEQLERVKDYHFEIIRELFTSDIHPVYDQFLKLISDLEEKLHSPPSDNYDFEYDQFVCYGELISTRIVSMYLESRQIVNSLEDAREWLRTDNTFREANVDFEATRLIVREVFSGSRYSVFITQGFIGGTAEGFATTLGREGSDYTAAILANLLDAERLVVWKDVPGILTADPQFIPDAEKLDVISYQEAIELSFYGAKVIHPKTIKPLQNKNIPLYVKSFIDTSGSGTLIHAVDGAEMLKPILIVKKNQLLISLVPKDFSFVVEDCLRRIFSLFFKYRLKVNLIQHSAISFTICMDNSDPFTGKLMEEMGSDFRILYNEGLELITIRHYNPGTIERYTSGRQILVEQRSRSTVMFVVR